MNNIVEAAKRVDEIKKFDFEVHCPVCSDKQWSLFDKLYTFAYGKCVNCSTAEEIERLLLDNLYRPAII